MKDVLQTWLQTSGQDDQYEKNTVSQELEEVQIYFGKKNNNNKVIYIKGDLLCYTCH